MGIIKHVYNAMPTYDQIVPVLLEHDIDELADHCKLTPGNMNTYRTYNTFSCHVNMYVSNIAYMYVIILRLYVYVYNHIFKC